MIKHADPAYAAKNLPAVLAACGDRRRAAVDGGAFHGSWTRNLSEHFERVIAFEPMPQNFQKLTANAAALPGVELHEFALSDRLHMMIPRPGRGEKDYGWQMTASKTGPIIAKTIDWFRFINIDFIKLDLEGHEFQALKGARDTILRCRPVILIEEKFDKSKYATAFLIELGMRLSQSFQRDHLFTWPQ